MKPKWIKRIGFGLASLSLLGSVLVVAVLCLSWPRLRDCELSRWCAGLLGISVILGIPVSYLWTTLVGRGIAFEMPAQETSPGMIRADDRSGWFTGLIERLFFTVAIAANLSGTLTGMILWTTVKYYIFAAPQEDADKKKHSWFVSALGSLGSMLIAIAGGIVCRGSMP
jgi:hypothetical protein